MTIMQRRDETEGQEKRVGASKRRKEGVGRGDEKAGKQRRQRERRQRGQRGEGERGRNELDSVHDQLCYRGSRCAEYVPSCRGDEVGTVYAWYPYTS